MFRQQLTQNWQLQSFSHVSRNLSSIIDNVSMFTPTVLAITSINNETNKHKTAHKCIYEIPT